MSFGKIFSAELMKFRTITAYLISAAAAILLTALGALSIGSSLDADGNLPLIARGDSAASMGSGVYAVTIPSDVLLYVMMVIGVLLATADLRSGSFRVTSTMVPWRNRLLMAKFAAAATVTFAVTAVGLIVGSVGGLIGSGGNLSPLAGDGPVVLLGVLLGAPLAAVLGVATGLLMKSTGAAVAALLIWALGIEQVLLFLIPSSVSAYLPFKTVGANAAIIGVLGPLPGLGVFAVMVGVVVGAACMAHSRRDLSFT